MICPSCLNEATTLLRADAEQLLVDADKAHRDPRLRTHEETLRRQANGLALAIGFLRNACRREAKQS